MSVQRARALRKNISEPERVLWERFRTASVGVKFRRKHPIGRYILDFYAPSVQLAVEIDGDSHYETARAKTRDVERDTSLVARGLRVLRFTNHDVMENIDGVCKVIADAVRGRTSPPLAPPLPEAGRGGNVRRSLQYGEAGRERNRAMIILGLDPGIARLGYGVIATDDGCDRCVTYGVLTTKPGAQGSRLLELRDRLRTLIAEHRPDRVCVERLYFSKNVKTATVVGEARGVILLTCAEAGTPIVEVQPQEVKQAVAGYGAADKAQVQRMVQALLHLPQPPRPDDAADALAVALSGVRVSLMQ